MFATPHICTNAQTNTNTHEHTFATGAMPRQRGLGGGKLSSRDIFTLLVVVEVGAGRGVVVWVRVVFLWTTERM